MCCGVMLLVLIIYIYIYIYIYNEINNVILRAVSYIVLIRCRLTYNQHYAPYEQIFIYFCDYEKMPTLKKFISNLHRELKHKL